MTYEDIAAKADREILLTAGPELSAYIEGLEIVISYLEANLEAASGT